MRAEPGRAGPSRAWARVVRAEQAVGWASACEGARVLRVSVPWGRLEKGDALPVCERMPNRSWAMQSMRVRAEPGRAWVRPGH